MYKTVQQLMQYKLAVPNACVQMNQQQMYKTVCVYIMSSSIVFTVCTVQYALHKSIDIYSREKASVTISRFKIITHG